jgi:hypothetical protein
VKNVHRFVRSGAIAMAAVFTLSSHAAQFDLLWESSAPVKPDPYLSTFGFSEFWLR